MADDPKRKEDPKPKPTVKQVVDDSLADAEGRMTAGCLQNYTLFLQPFSKRYGSRFVETLTVAEAEAYARKREWSATYRTDGVLLLADHKTAYPGKHRLLLLTGDALVVARERADVLGVGCSSQASMDNGSPARRSADAWLGSARRLE